MENNMEIPLKTKNRGTIWYYSPIPECISREKHDPKGGIHPVFLVYDSQNMEATWMSTYRGMDKEDVVHTYNGILLSIKMKSFVAPAPPQF